MALTRNKDIDYLILDLLDDEELNNVCQINKRANSLCNDETFWKKRTLSRFGEYLFPLGINVEEYNKGSWKDYYIKLLNVVRSTKNYFEIDGGNRENGLNNFYEEWDKGINNFFNIWDLFKTDGLNIWVGHDYDRHSLGWRKLNSLDEKALALRVALINDVNQHKDIEQLPLNDPLFNPEVFYRRMHADEILKRKNLVHLEKLKQIFSLIDPNELIFFNNFFKRKRFPFLKLILEDKRIDKKGLLRSIELHKISKEAKPLIIAKLKELEINKKDLSKKIIKKLGYL